MRADWRINQCLFHHVAFASVTLLGAAFCHYYSGFYDYKSPWVLNMFAGGKCCLWANPLDWCASGTFPHLPRFIGYLSVTPQLSFYAAEKKRWLRKVDCCWFILSTHPPTHPHTYPHTNNNENPIFFFNLTRNTTDHWWKLIHASWVQGRSGLYFTESGRSHSATPCFRLHWRHVWLNGTAVRKLETYLLPRLVCVHVHFWRASSYVWNRNANRRLICCLIYCMYVCVCVCVQSLFVSV